MRLDRQILNWAFFIHLSCCTLAVSGQQVLSSAGGEYGNGAVNVEQTIGEAVVGTIANPSVQLTQGFNQPIEILVTIRVDLRALLEGPLDTVLGRMNDDLRTAGLIPLVEPYSGLGYIHLGGGGESIDPSILNAFGNAAIVDWVFLELRDKTDPTVVVTTRSALIRRDGTIVDVDGSSPVSLESPIDDYYIAVQHRNHFSVMTQITHPLSSISTFLDLSDPLTATFGTEARKPMTSTLLAMWAGDVFDDGILKYTGANNDRDPILVAVGGSVPTNTATGYLLEDVNMDGSVKYVGADNDRDPILVNIGGSIPTNTRTEQLP